MSETKRGKKRMNEEGNSTKDNQRARHWAIQVFRYHAVRSHFVELDDDMTLFMFLKAPSGCPVVSRLQNQQHQNQSNEDGGFEIGCFALDGKVCLDSGDKETYKYILYQVHLSLISSSLALSPSSSLFLKPYYPLSELFDVLYSSYIIALYFFFLKNALIIYSIIQQIVLFVCFYCCCLVMLCSMWDPSSPTRGRS